MRRTSWNKDHIARAERQQNAHHHDDEVDAPRVRPGCLREQPIVGGGEAAALPSARRTTVPGNGRRCLKLQDSKFALDLLLQRGGLAGEIPCHRTTGYSACKKG